jgi:hypothetical protein
MKDLNQRLEVSLKSWSCRFGVVDVADSLAFTDLDSSILENEGFPSETLLSVWADYVSEHEKFWEWMGIGAWGDHGRRLKSRRRDRR